MKVITSLLIILLVGTLKAGDAMATELEGKWGLGVAIGSLFSSGAEASIIRGASARTAWIADIVASVASDHRDATTDYRLPYYPDTTLVGDTKYETTVIEVGPRLRRFARPAEAFSPYGDVYAHFLDSVRRQSYVDRSTSDTQVGAKLGIAIGVEYFATRWPFSVAAHTDVATFSALHASSRSNDVTRVYTSSGTILSGMVTLRPVMQIRVYF